VEDNKAKAFFDDLLQNATVLYPNPLSLQNFKALLLKYKPKGNRVYDVELVSIMMSYEIRNIATLNESDFSGID
jgi:predicted nucleic acid-binding protein